MSNFDLRKALFLRHLVDLKNLIPTVNNLFVCPICLEAFPMEAIYKDQLTDGHVWPHYIRKKSDSDTVNMQRVLLCRRCNSSAGSRGDNHMQLFERRKDEKKTGRIGERQIFVFQFPDQEPIKLNAEIVTKDMTEIQLNFRRDRKYGRWVRNNPKEQEKFLALEKDEPITIVEYPYHGIDSDLVQIGWLTSAYLFAFYIFGYSYILDESLAVVRKHIHDSFIRNSNQDIRLAQSDVLQVKMCKEHYYSSPNIDLVVPLRHDLPVHLEVSFLNYHVILPFHAIDEIYSEIIHPIILDVEEKYAESIKQEMMIHVHFSRIVEE